MATDFVATRKEFATGLRELADANPSVMDGFTRLHRSATADGTLSQKHKELMAVAISIAVRCDGCISFHVHDAVRAGATRDEMAETAGVAVLMGGGPSAMYATEAMTAFDQFEAKLQERSS